MTDENLKRNSRETYIGTKSKSILGSSSSTNMRNDLIQNASAKCSIYTVTAVQLNVRDKPGKPSNILGRVNKGDRVCVYSFSGKWGKTDYGWISGKFLTKYKGESDIVYLGFAGEVYHNYKIQGKGEDCTLMTSPPMADFASGSCIEITNSKGVKIFCTKNKTMCKTAQEFYNFANTHYTPISNSNRIEGE